MIKFLQQPGSKFVRLLTTVLVLAAVTACTKDEATDYCKNHYVFHHEHKDQLTTLDVSVAENGLVTAVVTLKGDVALDYNANPALQQSLMDTDSSYKIQSEGECADALITRGSDPGLTVLTFESQCTAGEKINQVDVTLFDTISGLDEVIATIITPATRKHFAISRQCDSAIYRLEKKQDKT